MDQDTLSLLGDCTAGIDMAVSTMDGILLNVKDQTLRRKIQDSMHSHQDLRSQTLALLRSMGGQEQYPSPMAKGMAKLKITTKMALGGDDTTAAYLVADGCDMGVKSLCRSRNRYAGANQEAKFLAEQLIHCEEVLSAYLRPYF